MANSKTNQGHESHTLSDCAVKWCEYRTRLFRYWHLYVFQTTGYRDTGIRDTAFLCQVTTDSSFCLIQTSSPIIQHPTCSGLGGRRPRVRGEPRVAPRRSAATTDWRDAYQLLHALVGYLLRSGLRFHPGDIHFSQAHCHPLSNIQLPRNGTNGPKGLLSNKRKQNYLNSNIEIHVSFYLHVKIMCHLWVGIKGKRTKQWK